MDDRVCHVLRAGTQIEDRKNLRSWVDGQPEPQNLFGAAQSGAQFVQLQVREVQMEEEALVQRVCVLACARYPGGDGGLTVAENPFGDRRVQPFGQRREHYGNLLRGGFQTVHRGVASGSEGGVASLTAKGLDALGLAMLAIPDQRVDVSIGDPAIRALPIGTGVALGLHSLRCSAATFHLTPGAYRSRSSTQRGSGSETAGGAIVWRAGRCRRRWSLLRLTPPREQEGAIREPVKTPKQRQREQEADHEQEHEHMNDITILAV